MTLLGRRRVAFWIVVGTLFVTAQIQVWSSPTSIAGGRVLDAVLVAVYTLPLLLSRRFPLTVLLLVLAAATPHYWLGGSLGQPWFALVLVVYALGAHGSRRTSGVGMFAVAVSILSIDLPRLQQDEPLDEVLPAWFILAAAWGFGRWIQDRQQDHADLVARTEALERERALATRAAIAHERARIARELHDIVAHSLAVIVLQSQAANLMLAADPSAARQAMGSIESVGREGLEELRRLLQVLLVSEEGVDLDPRPSLRHLDLLLERVRATGLPVELTVDGSPLPLPPGIDASAYRIVQEALTNTLKHSCADHAAVDVRYRPGALEVRVSDNGSVRQHVGRSPNGRDGYDDGTLNGQVGQVGHGLIGMRERVTLYGGTLDTGRQPSGGFSVHATLPLEVPA